MEDESQEMIKAIKIQVAEVIIDLNIIEDKISDIIGEFINSDKPEFIKNILLNSLILNFSSKLKLLKYILKSENIVPTKDFFKAITIIMNKRNILAHSNSLLNFEVDVVDFDFDWSLEGTNIYPIYGPSEPNLLVVNDGNINYENISKIIKDFFKYFDIVNIGLNEIDGKLFPKIGDEK